jgi:hypothetical protein
MVASVDLDDLPAPAAKKVRSALADVDFEPAKARGTGGRRRAPAPFPDAFQYDLEVDDGKRRSITVRDPIASPELQALLDVLLPLAEPE